MKKIIALALALMLALACIGFTTAEDKKAVKLGVILLHDEDSTYDLNFLNAVNEARDALGIEVVVKKNINESNAC